MAAADKQFEPKTKPDQTKTKKTLGLKVDARTQNIFLSHQA